MYSFPFSFLPVRGRDAGYDLLRTSDRDVAPSTTKARRRCSPSPPLLFKAALAFSLLANAALVLPRLWVWPSPLDDYQALNDGPLLAGNLTPNPDNPYENTIVTSLFSDAFAPAVATLGHSLNKANSSAARLLFYLPQQVSAQALCVAGASGFVPHPVARIPAPHAGAGRHFLDQYAKLHAWALDTAGVRALVYLDADTLARANFDELFALPHTFAAVPDVYADARAFSLAFNAGVLFIRPDSARFRSMLTQIAAARHPPEEAEQAFLNQYYAADAVRLPYVYNANLAIKLRSRALWADVKRRARVVHYTLAKPFLSGDYAQVPLAELESNALKVAKQRDGVFKEEVMEWLDMWKETRDTYRAALAECASLSSSNS